MALKSLVSGSEVESQVLDPWSVELEGQAAEVLASVGRALQGAGGLHHHSCLKAWTPQTCRATPSGEDGCTLQVQSRSRELPDNIRSQSSPRKTKTTTHQSGPQLVEVESKVSRAGMKIQGALEGDWVFPGSSCKTNFSFMVPRM